MKDQLIAQLGRLCKCDISNRNIQDDAFSCGQLDHLIIYRGRILGSRDYSALGLVELMQSWVSTQQAFLTVDSFRMQVDPTCSTRLDTINAPDCPLGGDHQVTTPTPTAPSPTTPSVPTTSETKTSQPKVESVRGGEVGGIIIGVVIVILLIALLLVIAMIIVYKVRKQGNKMLRSVFNTT